MLTSKVLAGGFLVLSLLAAGCGDYAYSEDYHEQRVAMDALGRELGFSVLTLPTGQGLIIKTGSLGLQPDLQVVGQGVRRA